MKLKLLPILLFIISNTIYSQIVTIPDAEFKNALLNYSPSIDTNNDNEIQVTEATAITTLNISGHQGWEDAGGTCPDPNDPNCVGGGGPGMIYPGISDFTGIEAFVNLTSLTCSQNDLSSLDVSALSQLTYLDCSNNINYNIFSFPVLGIATLSLPSSSNLTTLICDNNNLTSLDVSNNTLLTSITVNNNVLSSLNLTNTPLLSNIKCQFNQLPSLDVSTSVALTNLECFNNQITGLNTSSNTSLITLKSYNNNLSTLILPTSSSLTHLYSWNNNITSLDASVSNGLKEISVYNNSLTNLILPTTTTLTKLLCYQNNLTSLDTSVASGLITINTSNNSLTSLTLPTSSTLKTLICNANQLPTLDTSVSTGLISINTASNLLTALTLPNSSNLESLICTSNQLATLNVNSNTGLKVLTCNANILNTLDVSQNGNLTNLNCSNNNLTDINTLSNTLLTTLYCGGNQLTNIDTTTINTVKNLYCSGNPFTDLDFSSFSNLLTLFCSSNPTLSSLSIKNGNTSNIINSKFYANNNPNLLSICVDDATVAAGMYSNIDSQTNFTEYCSFVPVNSNTITGTISYDFNNNGCDAADVKSVNTRINTFSSNVTNSSFSAADGTYTIHINDTSVTTELIPNFPSFFTATPVTQATNFTGSGNSETIDFCITANSQVDDVTVSSFTTSESRPGFDTHLRILYKNNGSTTLSGAVTLNFNQNQEVFNNASVTPDSQTTNSLTWNYTNLLPFEENFIDVYFTINTPTDATNPVNGGDTISYTTNITPLTNDATPSDNTHIFSDIIVNAYDPNDVICFEGDKISTTQVPNDLTYRVRFQNTGTASAINIVVKETIDTDLDMATFQPISASHNYRIAISNTNKLEFIFENIHLADSTSNEPASHGWIFYKIKPKNTAVIGDAFDTTANIYFDYNAPVITNTYNTVVSAETSIPDSNFEMALITAGLDNGIPNNKVFTNNINTITNLDVSNKNIADLTGIEDFSALTTLNVNNNQLTTLDFSNHTLLNSLDVNSNTLTALNVKNGNNNNFVLFNANNNSNLTCIEVDNATWSSSNWPNIDATSTFVNNQAECTALSTNKYNSIEFSLHPNPTNGFINIEVLEKSDLIIYSITGKEISKRKLNIGNNKISNLNLVKGIYLFKLINKDKSSSKKVIIN
jgi:Leucine-rich repeat (LRR) protein